MHSIGKYCNVILCGMVFYHLATHSVLPTTQSGHELSSVMTLRASVPRSHCVELFTAGSLHNDTMHKETADHCKEQKKELRGELVLFRRSVLWIFISLFQCKCRVVVLKQNVLMPCAFLDRNKIQLNLAHICILDSLTIKI